MGTGSTSVAPIPFSSRKASNVWTSEASRCQSGADRRYMPSGMLSVQKPRGRPMTIASMSFSIAFAAVAIPYGPAPITANIHRPPFESDSRPSGRSLRWPTNERVRCFFVVLGGRGATSERLPVLRAFAVR